MRKRPFMAGVAAALTLAPAVALAAILAAILAVGSAQACGFHGYTPQPSLVDRLLASDQVVLARASALNPFRYEAVAVLAGGRGAVDIPDLVDTATRRRLAREPAAVLFARTGAYSRWQRLAYVDAAFHPILAQILSRLPAWDGGDADDRLTFFAGLLPHPDPAIHRLALKELDKADYGPLRRLELAVPAARVAARLDRVAEADLKPIRVLLLGLTEDPSLVPYFKARVRANAGAGSAVLGAYATALIETEGAQAVGWITHDILTDAAVPLDSKELLVEAMAIHAAAGAPATAAAVAAAMQEALRQDASLAPAVARQFGQRADWSLEVPLSDLLRRRALSSPSDILVVTHYVALAGQTR